MLGERLGLLHTDEDALTLDDQVAALGPDDPIVYAAFLRLPHLGQELLAMLGRGLFA